MKHVSTVSYEKHIHDLSTSKTFLQVLFKACKTEKKVQAFQGPVVTVIIFHCNLQGPVLHNTGVRTVVLALLIEPAIFSPRVV